MNRVAETILKNLCDSLVRQGPNHESNIIGYFTKMVHATRKEFTEDNKPVLDIFLRECFEKALETEK